MIRLLSPEEFAVWKTIRLEAVREHPQAYGGAFEEESLRTDEQWAHVLRDNHVFVFFDRETPVGVAGFFVCRGRKKSHRAVIFTVYVKQSHRGRGIMDWLLGAMEYNARDLGVEQMHLEVGIYNLSAIRCYERNGFAIYGTEPRALKMNGDYIDEYLMVKYL